MSARLRKLIAELTILQRDLNQLYEETADQDIKEYPWLFRLAAEAMHSRTARIKGNLEEYEREKRQEQKPIGLQSSEEIAKRVMEAIKTNG